LLRAGKQIVLQLQSAVEPIWTKIILSPFEQGSFEWLIQQLANNRDVFLEQLLLEIDGVGRNDGFTAVLQRKENSRYQVSQGLADAGPGFCNKMMVTLQSTCHRRGHLLLFGAVLEILCAGQDASFPKHFMNVSGKPLVEIVAQRDHRCPLLKAVLPVFSLKRGAHYHGERYAPAQVSLIMVLRLSRSSQDLQDGRRIGGPDQAGLKSQNTKRQNQKSCVSNI